MLTLTWLFRSLISASIHGHASSVPHESASHSRTCGRTFDMVGIGLAGTPFAGRFSDAPRHNRSLVSGWTRAAPLPGPHPLPLAPLHLRQRRLRLGQPEGHVHRLVHLDGWRNTRFSQSDCVEKICFNGFSCTGACGSRKSTLVQRRVGPS
jgi:hypothetical protein